MARTPVLFVPGFCGSFNLGVLLDVRGPSLSGWGFPPFIDYGKNLLDSFAKAGYTRDRDLFVAFYDWRKSVKDSATLYLKPWIDRAKQRSGAATVALVCHSMGGLVARSYIQSRAYAGDVAEVITLGTPHRGSAEAYYPWGSGEIRADGNVRTVFNVYLWYLRHAHPFQSQMSPLKTIRTQVPGVRDLLPIDDYLFAQGSPPKSKPEDELIERNLVGDLLNQPAAVATLLERARVTTITGVGFSTIKGITVAGPPTPPGDPPAFPDGKPVADIVDANGDGTVMRVSARVAHAQAKNTPPLQGVSHGNLADSPAALARVFATLGVSSPALAALPATEPRLVVMTASPVLIDVTTPGGPPMAPAGALGAGRDEAPRRRRQVVRARDHGHQGKHLNIAVIPWPAAGSYMVHLKGTATGSFALGAMLVGPDGVTVLGGAADAPQALEPQPQATRITTRYGRVSAGSELYYEVSVHSLTTAPQVSLDAARTVDGALARLRAGVGASGGLLGASEDSGDPVETLLGDADPMTRVDALCAMAERVVGPDDPALAEALITQLRAAQGKDE